MIFISQEAPFMYILSKVRNIKIITIFLRISKKNVKIVDVSLRFFPNVSVGALIFT